MIEDDVIIVDSGSDSSISPLKDSGNVVAIEKHRKRWANLKRKFLSYELGDSDDTDDSSEDENYVDSEQEDLDGGDNCAAIDMDYEAEDARGHTREQTAEEAAAVKEAVARDFHAALTVANGVQRSDLSRDRKVRKLSILTPGKNRNSHFGNFEPKQINVSILTRI